jgi:hypothetical protein
LDSDFSNYSCSISFILIIMTNWKNSVSAIPSVYDVNNAAPLYSCVHSVQNSVFYRRTQNRKEEGVRVWGWDICNSGIGRNDQEFPHFLVIPDVPKFRSSALQSFKLEKWSFSHPWDICDAGMSRMTRNRMLRGSGSEGNAGMCSFWG